MNDKGATKSLDEDVSVLFEQKPPTGNALGCQVGGGVSWLKPISRRQAKHLQGRKTDIFNFSQCNVDR